MKNNGKIFMKRGDQSIMIKKAPKTVDPAYVVCLLNEGVIPKSPSYGYMTKEEVVQLGQMKAGPEYDLLKSELEVLVASRKLAEQLLVKK